METISVDLAGKVLTANLRNIIAKVQDGRTLTGPEVQVFESVLSQESELQARLTAEEMVEITDLGAAAGPPDQPQADAPPHRYEHTRNHYAALFSQTARTINRWIAHGKAQDSPPPLDDPEAMIGWWMKHMKHRVPASLLRFKAPPSAVDSPQGPGTEPPEAGEGEPRAAGVPERGSVGMAGMLKRMREAERDAAEKYQLAQGAEPPDPSLIEMRRRAWDRMAETLRKLEKDSPRILEASGDVLPRAETVSELGQMLGVFALTWRGFARRMLPVMRGMSIEQSDKHWNLESDRVFAGFQKSRFAEVIEPEAG